MLELNKIYCEDCLNTMSNMPDKCCDVITDPPYNVKKDYGEFKDNLKPSEYLEFIKIFINEARRISDNKIVLILGSKMVRDWWNFIPDAKLVIIKMGAISNNKIKNLNLQFHCLLTTIKSNKWDYDLWQDIRWPGEGYFFNEKRYGHPAMTPLKLMKKCIIYFSNHEIIYDPFMGSGTMAIACLNLEKKYIGSELNPEYIKIAEKRIFHYKQQLKLF